MGASAPAAPPNLAPSNWLELDEFVHPECFRTTTTRAMPAGSGVLLRVTTLGDVMLETMVFVPDTVLRWNGVKWVLHG